MSLASLLFCQRVVFCSASLIAGVLEILHECQTQRVHKGSKARHREVQHVTENEDDDASARLCMDNGVQLVVIKRGEDGATGYTAEGEKHHQGMFPSRVISLQGAGDSYSGTFCSRLVRGACLSEAMKYAAASAALTVSGRSQMTKEFVAVCEAGHADQWEFWS